MDAYSFWKNFDSALSAQTLKSVADKAGLNYRTIKNQRSAVRLPNLDDAYALSQVLCVSLEYLLTGKDSSSISPEAQFVESNETMKTLVRYCMNDARLLPALELVIEQSRADKGVDKGLA